MQLLNCRHGSVPVTLHDEDPCWGRHLEDQIPVMGNGHEPVQSRPANNGIEWEVDLHNIELNILCAEFFRHPERDRLGDGPHRVDEMWAHSEEWA
jgi:hypothetical protein